jgi:hypothetical protein
MNPTQNFEFLMNWINQKIEKNQFECLWAEPTLGPDAQWRSAQVHSPIMGNKLKTNSKLTQIE